MTPPPRPALAAWQHRALPVVLAAALTVVLYRFAGLLFFASPTHDQSWYLYAATLVLSGVKLYGPRLTETNPPLIVWFSMLPNLLGRWLHLSPVTALKLILTFMAAVSTAASLKILRISSAIKAPILLYLTAFTVASVELFTSASDLAQREQMLVMLILPYVFAAICSVTPTRCLGTPERIATGIAAGVGLCFKPQQALCLIVLELLLVAWTRSLRRTRTPELLALLLTAVTYVALIRLITPRYLTDIIPLLRNTYWAFGAMPANALLLASKSFLALFLLTTLAWALLRHDLHIPVAPPALLASSFGAAVASTLQHTGWSYQFFPQRAFLVLAGAWLVIDRFAPTLVRLASGRAFLKPFAAALTVFAMIALPVLVSRQHHLAAGGPSPLLTLLTGQPPGAPVYIVSTSLGGFDVVTRQHLRWASRYAHLWMLPAIVQNLPGAPTPRRQLSEAMVASLSTLLRSNAAEDLSLYRPALVLVDRCTATQPCQGIPLRSFDLIAWFQQDPAFAAEWSHYHRQQTTSLYVVYTRVPYASTINR